MSAARPRQPRRVLLPGTRVLNRGRDTWQLGIDPATAARFRRTPALDRVLHCLGQGGVAPTDPEARQALATLEGHLFAPAALPNTGLGAEEQAAVVQRGARRAAARLSGRERTAVEVVGGLGAECDDLVQRLLERAGLAEGTSTVALVLSVGELPRERVDPLLRAGTPHLVVRLVDGAVLLGPFVVPGVTACLRCVDAHLTASDPLHLALVEQHAEDPHGARPDGVADPLDAALLSMAVSWAVRDLTTYAEGDQPTTWSATVRLDPGLAEVTSTVWLRAATCGCGWIEPVTMEA